MDPHPNSPTRRPKSWRHRVSIPGILWKAVEVRIEELGRETFSQHAIETVCFDLRIRREHSVTAQYASDSPRIQDAIDRFIVAHYRPWMERDGGMLRKVICDEVPTITRPAELIPPTEAEKHEVFFPPLLVERIEERWREVGVTSLSDYVTSIMRYDLLLGGSHLYFRKSDCTPEMIAGLDRETLTEYLKNRKPKIMLDYILERVADRELTREECEERLREVGRKIRALAIEYYLL